MVLITGQQDLNLLAETRSVRGHWRELQEGTGMWGSTCISDSGWLNLKVRVGMKIPKVFNRSWLTSVVSIFRGLLGVGSTVKPVADPELATVTAKGGRR